LGHVSCAITTSLTARDGERMRSAITCGGFYAKTIQRHASISAFGGGWQHRCSQNKSSQNRTAQTFSFSSNAQAHTPCSTIRRRNSGWAIIFILGDRNGCRTPMQWKRRSQRRIFPRPNPQQLYLPITIDPEYHYEAINVENQQKNLSSLLVVDAAAVIAMRKKLQGLFSRGSLEFFVAGKSQGGWHFSSPHRRRKPFLVVVNLSRFAQPVELDLRGNFPAASRWKFLAAIGSPRSDDRVIPAYSRTARAFTGLFCNLLRRRAGRANASARPDNRLDARIFRNFLFRFVTPRSRAHHSFRIILSVADGFGAKARTHSGTTNRGRSTGFHRNRGGRAPMVPLLK